MGSKFQLQLLRNPCNIFGTLKLQLIVIFVVIRIIELRILIGCPNYNYFSRQVIIITNESVLKGGAWHSTGVVVQLLAITIIKLNCNYFAAPDCNH